MEYTPARPHFAEGRAGAGLGGRIRKPQMHGRGGTEIMYKECTMHVEQLINWNDSDTYQTFYIVPGNQSAS